MGQQHRLVHGAVGRASSRETDEIRGGAAGNHFVSARPRHGPLYPGRAQGGGDPDDVPVLEDILGGSFAQEQVFVEIDVERGFTAGDPDEPIGSAFRGSPGQGQGLEGRRVPGQQVAPRPQDVAHHEDPDLLELLHGEVEIGESRPQSRIEGSETFPDDVVRLLEGGPVQRNDADGGNLDLAVPIHLQFVARLLLTPDVEDQDISGSDRVFGTHGTGVAQEQGRVGRAQVGSAGTVVLDGVQSGGLDLLGDLHGVAQPLEGQRVAEHGQGEGVASALGSRSASKDGVVVGRRLGHEVRVVLCPGNSLQHQQKTDNNRNSQVPMGVAHVANVRKIL
jgi:hypothetical protein